MGPKVEACLRFVDAGGESVIASLTEVGPAMAGRAGTHIVPDAPAGRAKKADGAKKTAAKAAGGTKKGTAETPAPKAPAGKPRRRTRPDPGAEVIDINTVRRRAATE